jgi:hypothetical protein
MTSSRIVGTAYATWYGADLQTRILCAMIDEPCQQAPGDDASAPIAINHSPKLPVPLPHFPMSTRLLPYTSQRPRKRVARTSTGAKRSSSQRLPCRAAFPLFALSTFGPGRRKPSIVAQFHFAVRTPTINSELPPPENLGRRTFSVQRAQGTVGSPHSLLCTANGI